MSEQKRISPLLDGFTMGSPMSDHDGVSCRPAIKDNTEKKYIVKTVTVPATQVQMDAMLLAGAFKDPSGAMDYFMGVAEDVVKEAELLEKLSKLEGFLPYEGWQIEPITRRRLGYEVYLISSYKRSLEKYLKHSPVTQLEAINLGLDICTALSVCRQAGSLYVDLKPSNIFISEHKEYRIGDLGFLSLEALKYSALPTKYHSRYTPPEFSDPMAPLNTTADTYALGMILYQLYNDSQLPAQGDVLLGTVPSPVNADYELAEIIMKAIHPDHQQRWQDPAAMGQALVAYMQRNTVNDVAITPHTPLEAEPEAQIPSEAVPEKTEEIPAPEDVPASPEKSPEPAADETAPGEEDASLMMPHEMSEELSRIVARADDLISHELPEPVVVPEAPELPDPFAFAAEDSDEIDDSDIPEDPVMDDPEEPVPEPPVKKKKRSKRFESPEHTRRVRKFLTGVLFLAALSAVCLCCWMYYQLFYLVPVDSITIDGTDQTITVKIRTEADDAALKVVCSDPYGNIRTEAVKGGKAVFTDLLTDTLYTVGLEAEGFHKLTGITSGTFTTAADTNIVSFNSVTGPVDGSLVLNFTVDGEEPKEWTVVCSAEGQKDRIHSFTGHSVTFEDLTIGTVYTFTLTTQEDLTISGETSIDVMASPVILAQELAVASTDGTDMTVTWKAPGDVVVDSWNVRCYNNRGFEVQFAVDDTKALIPDADPNAGYTIEVTASGMTQPARISITEDPVTVSGFTLKNEQDTTAGDLMLAWDVAGDKPRGNWLLMYTVDGAATSNVMVCKDTTAVISPRIPGAKYRFTLQLADGTTVFNNTHTYTSPEAAPFDQHGLTSQMITGQLLKTPEKANWRFETVGSDVYTDSFAVGDSISLVLKAESTFYLPGSETRILYVYRDAFGNVIPNLASQGKAYWKNLWTSGDTRIGEFDVPTAPESAGSYVLQIYIDGMMMTELPLTIQ